MRNCRRLFSVLIGVLALCAARAPAGAQSIHAYPVPWPKAGGGTLVAVPVADATVKVYRRVAAPHGTGWDSPFPTTQPMVINPALAGVPIILLAPAPPTAPNADEDDIFMLVSNQRLIISIADDERFQPGTPDRIFFMPATTGSFRGQEFYSEVNGGDPSERIRVLNLGAGASNVSIAAWNGAAWIPQGTLTVAAGDVGVFDPSLPQSAYRVTTTQDAMVVVGYLIDNATAPAPDVTSGQPVGSQLFGYGDAFFLRAVQALSYTVEARPDSGASAWTTVASGTLVADQGVGAQLPAAHSYVRITLTGGVGWSIVGTASLLAQTEWDGYFLPAQAESSCLVGSRFFTNSSARTISMLPNPGTTVKIFDEQTGALENTYTSTGAWEFHNFFWPHRARVEFSGGPGAVLLVGTLNWGGCDEATMPGNCGILEGAYSMPGLSGFHCTGTGLDLAQCQLAQSATCEPGQSPPDGGTVSTPDGAVPDAAAPDAASRPDGAPSPLDGGRNMANGGGGGCGCDVGGAGMEGPLGVVLLMLWPRRRRRASP